MVVVPVLTPRLKVAHLFFGASIRVMRLIGRDKVAIKEPVYPSLEWDNCRLDHRHNPGADRPGKFGPCIHDGCYVGVARSHSGQG
jgi:hypothetical protein